MKIALAGQYSKASVVRSSDRAITHYAAFPPLCFRLPCFSPCEEELERDRLPQRSGEQRRCRRSSIPTIFSRRHKPTSCAVWQVMMCFRH